MEEKAIIAGKFNRAHPLIVFLVVLGSLGSLIVFYLWWDRGFDVDDLLADTMGLSIIPILILGIGILLLSIMNNCSLIVTDKRVFGRASFGKRIDLPMNQISSVGIGWFNSVVVATSSGKIRFWLLSNKNEIHNAISKLLIKQQKAESQPFDMKQSAADELKQFKELLDSGVITQEEFDAKKKQLLGL